MFSCTSLVSAMTTWKRKTSPKIVFQWIYLLGSHLALSVCVRLRLVSALQTPDSGCSANPTVNQLALRVSPRETAPLVPAFKWHHDPQNTGQNDRASLWTHGRKLTQTHLAHGVGDSAEGTHRAGGFRGLGEARSPAPGRCSFPAPAGGRAHEFLLINRPCPWWICLHPWSGTRCIARKPSVGEKQECWVFRGRWPQCHREGNKKPRQLCVLGNRLPKSHLAEEVKCVGRWDGVDNGKFLQRARHIPGNRKRSRPHRPLISF